MNIIAYVTARGNKVTKMRKGFVIEVKPCPCCGNYKLSVGVQSCMGFGVCCDRYNGGCGLKIEREYSNTPSNRTLYQTEKALIHETVNIWNNRI